MEIGYNPDIFARTLDPSFICPICQHVIREAVSCKTGHLFCKTCIETWLNVHHRRNCPVGRSPLLATDLRGVIVFDSLVQSLPTFCQNLVDGCRWTGSLENRSIHLQQCLQEPVPCTHMVCGQMVRRGELVAHLITCEWRHMECHHCRAALPAQELAFHRTYSCKKAPVLCPLGCNDGDITRENLNGHIAMECRRAFVKCKVPACTAKVRREDLECHRSDNSALHVDLLMAERRLNQMSNVVPSLRPTPVNTFDWVIRNFNDRANSNPEVGVRSPLFSSMDMIVVPKTSASGNMGIFVCHQGADGPSCVNLSVALRNGREIFVKRAPEARWLHPESPVGWDDFLPLDEVINRYVGQDGALIIQISFQVLE